MIIACFICSFYLGLAGEVGKTKLVLESGYGYVYGRRGGEGRGLQVSPCAYVEVRGQAWVSVHTSYHWECRLASLQTPTDSPVSIFPSQHKSASVTDMHYCACWSISPDPEYMIFKSIFLWPSEDSRKHPASLPLHGAAFIWHFWHISSNSEGRGGVWVSSRYQRWTRGWMRRGWCCLGLSS